MGAHETSCWIWLHDEHQILIAFPVIWSHGAPVGTDDLYARAAILGQNKIYSNCPQNGPGEVKYARKKGKECSLAWGPWEPLGIGSAEHQIRFGEERQIDREHQIGFGGTGGVQ